MKPLLIGGQWIQTSAVIENINPSNTNDRIDRYAQGGRSEVQAAVDAASTATLTWGLSTPEQRHDVLARASQEVMARSDELGEMLSREEGKVLADGIAEAKRSARILDFYAGETLRTGGELHPSTRPDVSIEISREPLGVVGVITPWNFPLAIPAWKIAPALAFGNTVVFKPSELVLASAWALVDILHRAGTPPGVLNLVIGPGSDVGGAIVEDPRVHGLTFTGSTETGGRIAEGSFGKNRRLQLEMGGKNPLVVLDDADLDMAVACALDGAYYQSGQRCTASSRLIVTEGIYSRFVEKLVDALRSLRIGHALDPDTDIGPVVSQAALESLTAEIFRARSDGATLRFGGEILSKSTPGHYLSPALFTDSDPSIRLNREEIFGPVASVLRVRDYDEALALANDTAFGLSAGICTTSLKHSAHFKRNAQAGMVMVNLPTAGVDYHVPFGGRKASSQGPREQGQIAREFYTTVKTSYTQSGA